MFKENKKNNSIVFVVLASLPRYLKLDRNHHIHFIVFEFIDSAQIFVVYLLAVLSEKGMLEVRTECLDLITFHILYIFKKKSGYPSLSNICNGA